MSGTSDDAIWDRPRQGAAPGSDEWSAPASAGEHQTRAGATAGGADDLVVGAPAATARTRRSRGLLAAAVAAAVVVAGGGAALGIALSSSSSSLGGKTPAQILAASLAAARQAGSFHVVSTSASDAGDVITFDIGAAGGTFSISSSGSAPSSGTARLTVSVVHSQTYLHVTGPGFPAAYTGRWLRVPASETAQVEPIDALLTPAAFLDAFVALEGPITSTPGPPGSNDVVLHGVVPPSRALGTGADAGQLEISGTAPFYPVKLTYSDGKQGTQVYTFSSWGEPFAPTAPAGAENAPASMFGSQPPASDVATEANLQTELTGALTYYTEQNQTFAGLDPSSLASIDTGVDAVPGSQPSTGSSIVSVSASSDWFVEAGWTPATGDCLAIIDSTAVARLDGADRTGTYYIETPGAKAASCRAATYAGPGAVPGSKVSTAGFSGAS